MAKMIAQLWNGELEPGRYFGKENRELKQLEHLLERNLKQLDQMLNESQKDIFSAYYDCMTEYLVITTEQAFCDGFGVGARLTAEALICAEGL